MDRKTRIKIYLTNRQLDILNGKGSSITKALYAVLAEAMEQEQE